MPVGGASHFLHKTYYYYLSSAGMRRFGRKKHFPVLVVLNCLMSGVLHAVRVLMVERRMGATARL